MIAEHERWAEALFVESHHGSRAPAYIAERIAALSLVGDEHGIARWKDIATCYDQLQFRLMHA